MFGRRQGRGKLDITQGKVLYSILVSIILFIGTQFMVLSRDLSRTDDERMTLRLAPAFCYPIDGKYIHTVNNSLKKINFSYKPNVI
jgi:hypothetical protein